MPPSTQKPEIGKNMDLGVFGNDMHKKIVLDLFGCVERNLKICELGGMDASTSKNVVANALVDTISNVLECFTCDCPDPTCPARTSEASRKAVAEKILNPKNLEKI